MSGPESLVEITPSQIIGEDAYMHLVFEGYEVVDAAELSTLRSRCAELEAECERLQKLVSSSEAERYRSCSALLARAETAEAALAPFAASQRGLEITIGQLDAARAVLAAPTQPAGKEKTK